MLSRRFAAVATVVALAATLVACTREPTIVEGSSVTVAVSGQFTSLNANSSYGRASDLNADIAYLTGSAFSYPDAAGELVDDTDFGTAEITADDPLTVRYTIDTDARWSDGVPVTPGDLLLAWAANSGALDTPDVDVRELVDDETGRLGELPPGVVHFDGAIGRGLELATQTPQPGDDGRSLFVHYDEFTPAWRTALAPGLPAHIVAARALELPLRAADAEPDTDPDPALAAAAVDALVEAIADGDEAALAALADTWNRDFDLTGAAPHPELLVANGPYLVAHVADGEVTLTANPRYRGDRAPTIETIVLTTLDDPAELVRRFERGEVDLATPEPHPDTASALADTEGVELVVGSESTFEHLDLQFTGSTSGHFDDPRVREAFLLTVPRQQILDELVSPVAPDAELLDSFTVRPDADGYAEAIAGNGSARYAERDIAGARRLLAEAGIASPATCILYDPSDARRVAAFALIQDSAADAGFRVTDCSRADWRSLLGVPGAYDAALFAWDTTRLGPGAVAAVFRSDSALANLNRFADPDADRLIDEILVSDDPGTRARAHVELDAVLWDAAYGVPLYAHPTLTVVSERLEGVERSPLARGVFWNAWEWVPAAPPASAPTP